MKFFRDNPIIGVALLLHLIVPFFSYGYFHPDEQFYGIEFMMLKLGTLDQLTFPWEYNAQIRPFSLPFLLFWIGKALGTTDVFILSDILRLISSLLGLFSLLFFVQTWKKRFPISKSLEWVLYLAWPLIFMHTRTNSENWSTSFYLIGISLMFSKRKNLMSGVILGLSFFLRFQIGFLILPIYWFRRRELKDLSWITVGIFISCALMVTVDFWGYGEWTLTPYNYFMVNLVQDKVSHFGISPWWYYLYKGLVKLLPFWGILILSSIVWGFKTRSKEFKEILIWILPFLLVHTFIGHKELRFIYPILPFLMILVVRFIRPKWQKILFWGNIIAFPILFMPQPKRLIIYKYLYKSKEISTVYWTHEVNPLREKSFIRKDLISKSFKHYAGEKSFYVMTPNYTEYRDLSKKFSCEIAKEIYPSWIRYFNIGGWVERSSVWVLGYCSPKLKSL